MSTATIDWILALAQNDYKQGQGRMSTAFGVEGGLDIEPTDTSKRHLNWAKVPATSSFCCLGLNRFMDPNGPEDADEYDVLTPNMWEYDLMGLTAKGMDLLVHYNDTEKLSFPQIALRLLACPDLYFLPKVTDEVIDYFYHNGEHV